MKRQKRPPRREKSCRRTPVLLPTLSNRAVTPDRPHLPPLFLPDARGCSCCPAVLSGGEGAGRAPRPWARPGLPPLPALLSPTRPRAHQAAAGAGGDAQPRSPAGPAGRGERSAEIPPGAASSRPGLSQGKHDAGGEPPISRGYRAALARAPAAPRLRPPPPPVRGHARLAAEGGAGQHLRRARPRPRNGSAAGTGNGDGARTVRFVGLLLAPGRADKCFCVKTTRKTGQGNEAPNLDGDPDGIDVWDNR